MKAHPSRRLLAWTRLASALALLLAACAAQTRPEPLPAAPRKPRLFHFASSEWVNLHHFLLLESTAKEPQAHPELSAVEGAAWKGAVEHYRQHLAKRSPLFDTGMREIRDRLAGLANGSELAGDTVDPVLAAVLRTAGPVYRQHFWPQHHAANQRMITRLESYREHFSPLAEELSRLFRQPWPDEPVRVDVVVYADWSAAYTTIEPTHLTIAAEDPRNQGDAALEILFHEAAHGLIRPVSNALAAETTRQGVKLERNDLWHTLLFDTTGEVVRRHLPPSFVPYAEKQDRYTHSWARFRAALQAHWRPYVDGKASFGAAIAAVVAELKAASTP